ncbi:hypothetical protein CRG98_007332 [Punica granatum]|uniref:Aminotransferase-like plant mobile domain-containing protein n=1 Tax=Punica granatum TaxID=22663 RepID=A0A2I0KUW3_PUNGR|nr:hypothetical protein CRG98_007332 [Punica granatum]
MDRSHPCLRLDVFITPSADITRLWNTFRPVDRAFLQLIIGDLPLLADSPIDWTLLRTAISFWDTQRVVFSFQGSELAKNTRYSFSGPCRPTTSWCPTSVSAPHRDYTNWIQFFKRLTPAQFLWAARWNPGGPMTIGCPSVIGLPLISHLGSTLVFPARVIRQLSGLQDIPIEADRSPYRFVWMDIIALLPDRVLRIREVRRLWGTRTIQELYFPEHPTDDERAFSATVAYVAQFHPQGLTPVRRRHLPQIPHASQAGIPNAESSVQGAIRTELQSIREERDRLRCELVDIRAELTAHRELQSELAQIRVRIANQDWEIAHLSATLDRARAKAHKVSHP